MRCFIGIPVKEWEKEIEELLKKIKRGTKEVKWIRKENAHITLRFLGEINEEMVDKIKRALEESLHNLTSFSIKANNLGAFPSLSSPRVIWLGIEEGKERVEEVFKKIERGLINCGISPEGRKFHPHVTLGRVKGRVDKGWWKGVLNAKLPRFPLIPVREISLYQSRLHPDGAEYIPLERYNLEELQ